MSVINLVGELLAPVYPAVFLVRSDVMDEIEHRYGRFFDGTLGTLQLVENLGSCVLTRELLATENPELALVLASESTPSPEDPQIIVPVCAPFQCRDILPQLPYQLRFFLPNHVQAVSSILFFLAGILGILVPILIIYHISRLHQGRSSRVQRVWVMTRLAFGWYIGIFFGAVMSNVAIVVEEFTALELAFARVAYSVPAIGGVVVVGQMIKEYGDCKRL